jgi:hypothetical protein
MPGIERILGLFLDGGIVQFYASPKRTKAESDNQALLASTGCDDGGVSW